MSIFKTISITFEIHAQHQRDGQFTIPKQIMDLLGLKSGDDIHLVVNDEQGNQFLQGVFPLRSGSEIYGPEVQTIIKAGQLLNITASRPS